MTTDITFAIVGTGFAGLGAAIALRRAGYRDSWYLDAAGRNLTLWPGFTFTFRRRTRRFRPRDFVRLHQS
jgi:cation diffusion facilitator CzcD-associated flavoprotein CzcO